MAVETGNRSIRGGDERLVSCKPRKKPVLDTHGRESPWLPQLHICYAYYCYYYYCVLYIHMRVDENSGHSVACAPSKFQCDTANLSKKTKTGRFEYRLLNFYWLLFDYYLIFI